MTESEYVEKIAADFRAFKLIASAELVCTKCGRDIALEIRKLIASIAPGGFLPRADVVAVAERHAEGVCIPVDTF